MSGKFVIIGDQIGHKHFRGMVVDGEEFGDMLNFLLTNEVIRRATDAEARHAKVDLSSAGPAGSQRLPFSAEDRIAHLQAENARLRQENAVLTSRANDAERRAREWADGNERLRNELVEEKGRNDALRQRMEGQQSQAAPGLVEPPQVQPNPTSHTGKGRWASKKAAPPAGETEEKKEGGE
jgi:hypothetical protein